MVKEHQLYEFNVRPDLMAGNRSVPSCYPAREDVRIDVFDAVHKVGRSIAYMEEHVNRPLQVATLAALANVSPSHFYALFKREMGCPPMDYFTRLRMRRACRLFETTNASVKEVAAALGYDDPFYFSRVFKAFNRIPPSRYRSAMPGHSRAQHRGSEARNSRSNYSLRLVPA